MTDATDIKALMLKMRNLADRIIDAEGENNNGEVGKIIEMYDAADTTFKAQNILLVLNAFEAERQRADYGQQVINQRNAECDRLINEIAALKAKRANPVVPPRVEGILKQWQFERDCEWIEAIHAAGFTIKGE